MFWYLTTFLEPGVSRGSWPRAGKGNTGWMAVFPLHQDLGSCVRQPQPHESSTHQHGGGQQDGDSFGDADQGTKYQVSQDGRCFAQCVQEAKACGPAKDRDMNKAEKVSSKSPTLDTNVSYKNFQ